MQYKTESRNATEFINLHDCECLCLSYENFGIIMEMEWMEVLGEHPENPYDMAYSSDRGIIEFNDVIIIDCKINYENNCVKAMETDRHFKIEYITLYHYFEDSKIDSVYKYAEISGFTPDNEFINIEFLFKESYIRWNKPEDISWFESKERLESEKSEKEIIKMLSCMPYRLGMPMILLNRF